MTLLEAVVATVLLALVAVACLDGTGQAARLQHQSVQTSDLVAAADVALESARLDLPSAAGTRVSRRPYGGIGALDVLTVEVTGPDGRVERLSRLVPRATGVALSMEQRP